LERVLLLNEQSRSRQIFAGKSKHDDFAAIPPSAALYSARPNRSHKMRHDLTNTIPDWPLLAQSGRSEKPKRKE
jgi:hypothetical protein